MKKLKKLEREEVLELQLLGTYRSNFAPVMGVNLYNGGLEPVCSFTLENIPKVDAMAILGGYAHPMQQFLEFGKLHADKYGYWPEALLIGKAPNKGQFVESATVRYFGGTEADAYYMLGKDLGADHSWLKRNHSRAFSTDGESNAVEIRQKVRSSPVLSLLGRPRVAVFSEAGYTLRMTQDLAFLLPEYELYIHEAPIVPEDKRLFVYESFDGYFVDLILACLFHAYNRSEWGLKRMAIPQEMLEREKDVMRTIKIYASKGYVFYLYPDNLQALGFGDDDIARLKKQRKLEILGQNENCEQVEERHRLLIPEVKDELGRAFIKQVLDEWQAKGFQLF